MSAPQYVPQRPTDGPRSYSSPPRRPEPWMADRPGDLAAGQPRGDRLGSPGPDQGYVLGLARHFEGKLHLATGEHDDDVVAGCVGVALKRASLFGRAPVKPDLTVAFTLWGFLDSDPPAELVALRTPRFAGAANPHHYVAQREIVDAVPAAVLRNPPDVIEDGYRTDWRALLDLTGT